MPDLRSPYRWATVDDAHAMTELVNMAGDGMPLYLWERMAAEGENAWDVGRSRARRDSGGFSYVNTVVLEHQGEVAACLIGYPLEDEPSGVDYSEVPPMFLPLQQLEDMAPGTWYVNVLAAYPEYRRKGFATGLLSVAEDLAAESGKQGLSIIVSDANENARRLYRNAGYAEKASRPMVKEDWTGAGRDWVLLVKDL